MTRFISLILSFYIAFGIVSIPAVQKIMPDYAREIFAVPETAEEDEGYAYYYTLSVIIPLENLDSDDEDHPEETVKLFSRQEVEQALESIPGLNKQNIEYFVLQKDSSVLEVSLSPGQTVNDITQVAFMFSTDNPDVTEFVETVTGFAARLPESLIYDEYSGEQFKLEQKQDLIKAIAQLTEEDY